MPEELTPSAIAVELRNLYNLMETISKTMVTKDLFDAKFDSVGDRVKRVELEQREWAEKSTQSHVELDRDSKARHQESNARIDAVRVQLENEIEKLEKEAKDTKTETETIKRSRFNAMLVAGLSLVVGLILKFFVPDIP